MPLDLDAIEARANAATPGPWTVSRSSSHPGERHIEAGLGAGVYVAMDVGADDAAFIGAARTDIPALVARVRELESDAAQFLAHAEDTIMRECERHDRAILAMRERVRELEAERDRLRETAAEHQRAVVALAEEYNRRDAVTAALRGERAELQGYCDRLLADGRAAALERDELAATLANERGEGAGPSEGWVAEPIEQIYDQYEGAPADTEWASVDAWVTRSDDRACDWTWNVQQPGKPAKAKGTAPTARAAMHAADLARGGK